MPNTVSPIGTPPTQLAMPMHLEYGRKEIATQLLAGMVANPNSRIIQTNSENYAVDMALKLTDALLRKLK